ncbi:Xaa-Pro aminopeptidase [Gemmobacter megaterium]|uniref:Xaa-Pro aminopeptidase n=1 Tax=Gemmobacter megaterium TaxID=1086013 RepID=A0A1N7NNS1_9RHOB|nr:aminopeptidase P family protein [Gemmobacter megaterium]GGE17747.1 Xaa-Pro aminopeptidase [Gemmobacter megaterium]SIS99858.1 Xaa-Pro aminopeptidase [Gemmobacter megaterium]
MLQSFTATTTPDQGPPRLAALRAAMRADGVQGFLVPRADAFQGEYVAACDERLAWLTGFTGSAGFCIALTALAGVFIDGRYRLQVRAQVAPEFTPVPWPETQAGPWLRANLASGVVGFDPWLHTADEMARIETALAGHPVTLRPMRNLLDTVWPDRPDPPQGQVWPHPDHLAGESSASKRARLGAVLRAAGHRAAVLTLPDSICWLLNIRGADVPRNPVVQAFAILHDDGRVTVFADPEKFGPEARAALGDHVTLRPTVAFVPGLRSLQGPVRVDRSSAPLAVSSELREAGVEVVWGDDPCRLPKACKAPAEIAASRAAHLRDGVAMAEFLCWLDAQAAAVSTGARQTEIGVVKALEAFRRATNQLHDLSFETICGAGPNGAIVHYRVTEATDRALEPGSLLLVDSGGQYRDGTTDITRTVAIGAPPKGAATAFTAVLQGMIAICRARWPKGLAGRDLDALARYNLWLQGRDYDHGTGHGVGAFLSVHEGPQRLSRVSEVPLEPGMILSNEPGYYREGHYGIRIENLVVVQPAGALPEGDTARSMLEFETLTLAPIDRTLILADRLSPGERDWLNAYHARVLAEIGPQCTADTRAWLTSACAPI